MSDFTSLLLGAASDALSGKNLQIFNARFANLKGAEVISFEEIGAPLGLSGIRARQAVSKSLNRIRWKASRQLKRGESDAACAKLILAARAGLGTEMSPHAVLEYCDRFQATDRFMFAYLIVNLLMPPSDQKRLMLSNIKRTIDLSDAVGKPLPQLPACATI